MKKQILILASVVILLVINSCSSDSETIVSTPKLPTKLITTHVNSSSTIIEVVEYMFDAENRLIKTIQTSNGLDMGYINYTYENNKLKQLDFYNENNELTEKGLFEYNGDNIIKRSDYINEGTFLLRIGEYIYDSNSKVIELKEIDFHNNQQNIHTTTFEHLADNTIKGIRENSSYYIIEFDDKKAPFSNVPSLSPFLKINTNITFNNRLSYKYYINNQLSSEDEYSNTYDNDNFLIKQVRTGSNNVTITTKEYTYNQ